MNSFKEIYCSCNGQEMYGYLQHNNSKNNLVLIPGSYTHHSIWEPVIKNAGVDANILLVELPGFGKSRPVTPDGTIEEFAVQILKLIDSAGINRFFIGGHSIGGMISIEMIDIASDRIDGVIPCEGWTHSSVEKEAFGSAKVKTYTEEQLKLRSHYDTIGSTHWTDDERKRYGSVWRKWENGLKCLEKAEMPILGLWGDRNMDVRPGFEKLQIPNKKNYRAVWIENCDHSMLVQYPEQIGEIIAEFIMQHQKV